MTKTTFPHENEKIFKQAITDVHASSLFPPNLIEKDYYCSLILRELYSIENIELIFKGGTLLNKVYLGFYRLSEDLDFSISMRPDASRKERSKKVQPYKQILDQIAINIPEITLAKKLKGSNNSTQYNAEFKYNSVLANTQNSILFEVGLREEALQTPIKTMADTMLIDTFSSTKLIPQYPVICYSKNEAYAEKLRAALSREKPAIRDIFDIDYAIRSRTIDLSQPAFKDLVTRKLLVPVKRVIDISESRKAMLKLQLDSQLAPVLRPHDFNEFDFEAAWARICDIGLNYTKLMNQTNLTVTN